ncbi:mitochondrial distribution and morphology protein 10 [Moesziomyces antarcticus]|uniref:Related to MDM10 - mitochondrial morphology and inheritance component n=2 Tax=Pseudozyma antarctica TaxID=84753 RepID=A0A5C3FNY8_PSEA2|nr:mitochondrial distribution and morphology protein 10 [Moesziomyces antarcticus]GAK64877.1 mitochondrial distribution and morphology protein 10 [Moesziomyces antarcticus]SPO46138.1 related to MDM10 - mitochondrial morphology and inheritance component [Moesziomyces antarcticus]
MHDFVSHVLRRYFEATAWNEYNSYLHLTSSSASILDFPIPTGLTLSISASPTPPFFTTYRLGALPNLRAGIGYIYASTHAPINFGKSSKDVKLKEVIERFRIVEAPRKLPPQTDQEYYWLAGERHPEPSTRPDGSEYLVYGCMHVPSARLDALWTKRLSPTWQLILTAVSTPPKYPINALHSAALATQSAYASGAKAGMAGGVDRLDASGTLSASTVSSSTTTQQPAAASELGPAGSTNLQLTLQRDTGRWFTEYSYSVDDALWGFRVLHNFGLSDTGEPHPSSSTEIVTSGQGRIDSTAGQGEGDADAGGGLRGRFSAGAEVFVSTVEKSAGLSTGIRFSTLPDSPVIAPDAAPSQPPTVITATLNPMMGHLSTAYAARMARDVVVCSRFDFNVYSYESEWTVGAEYWLRAAKTPAPAILPPAEKEAVSKTMSLRDAPHPTDYPLPPSTPSTVPGLVTPAGVPSSLSTLLSPITGVLKARISTASDIRLLWQGRLSHCLVSLGVKADLSPSATLNLNPGGKAGIVKSVGVEVMYFSQADD